MNGTRKSKGGEEIRENGRGRWIYWSRKMQKRTTKRRRERWTWRWKRKIRRRTSGCGGARKGGGCEW